MSIWSKKLIHVDPIKDLTTLPDFGFQFFFKNARPFRREFWALTVLTMVSTVVSYAAFKLVLSYVISNIEEISSSSVLTTYLPLFLFLLVLTEGCDFFIRRYAEALPFVYSQHASLRIFKALSRLSGYEFLNYSKEKLKEITDKYVSGVEAFLKSWFWNDARKIVLLVMSCVIFYIQSPIVLLINVVYFALFFVLAYRLSKQFSLYARKYTKQTIRYQSLRTNLFVNFSGIKRIGQELFFENTLNAYTGKNWEKLDDVRRFHARRWFIQLNLMRVTYVGSLAYAIIQIINGQLPLGFLILLQTAYGDLIGILISAIEFYVNLLQERENSRYARKEYSKLVGRMQCNELEIKRCATIELSDVTCSFPSRSKEMIQISIPKFSLGGNEKIGIVGESGSGKSTLLHVLMNLVDFKGTYLINGKLVEPDRSAAHLFSLVTSSDPLFNLTIEQNIKIGEIVDEPVYRKILSGCRVDDFCADDSAVFGRKETNFSAGQLQRIRLARGLLRDQVVYLLDEPFTALDQENRRLIKDFINKYLDDKPVVVVSHMPEDLDWMDRLYRFEGHVLKPLATL